MADHLDLYRRDKLPHVLEMSTRLMRWRNELERVLSLVCDSGSTGAMEFPPPLRALVAAYVRVFDSL